MNLPSGTELTVYSRFEPRPNSTKSMSFHYTNYARDRDMLGT